MQIKDRQHTTTQVREKEEARQEAGPRISKPPQGWQRLAWLGPGFLWLVSAAGSGELLFTPRVGSLYGYTLLWALIATVILKWFINREIGRFAVCTGASVLEGFKQLPGPGNWALWLILVPQFFVAIATIAGLGSSAATALILLLPGNLQFWMIVTVVAGTALVLWGRYRGVERAATILAGSLALASIVATVIVFPDPAALASGLVPQLPPEVDYGEILPWLGFMLSGAAGLMWYSYWITAKGYGAAEMSRNGEAVDPGQLSEEERSRLRGWVKQMTLDNTAAVVGTLIITLAFLILGVELLRPEGIVPQEDRVAETIGRLLGDIWGSFGFWFMIVAVLVGFWSTVLSDQDGFGRLFANGTRILLRPFNLQQRWKDEAFLKNVYVIGLVTLLPIGLYLIVGRPVMLLQIAGGIEAAHIPVVAGLILYLNHRRLPRDLRASWPVFGLTALAGLFFAAFAIIYIFRLMSGGG